MSQQHFDFVRRETPAAWSKTDWQAVADALRAVGLPQHHRAIDAAKGAGKVPDDVRELLAEYRANAHRFNGPEAILYCLANGRWPAERPTPSRARDPKLAYEMRRFRLFKRLQRAGKTQQEIDAEVERLLRPSAFSKHLSRPRKQVDQ